MQFGADTMYSCKIRHVLLSHLCAIISTISTQYASSHMAFVELLIELLQCVAASVERKMMLIHLW